MKYSNGSSAVGPSLVSTPDRRGPGADKTPKVDPQLSPLSSVKWATKKVESHSRPVGYHCAGGKSY